MFKLLLSLVQEFIDVGKLHKDEVAARTHRYFKLAIALTIAALVITLGLVTNRAIILSIEYTKLKADYNELERQMHKSKSQQNDSFDSGNGLSPKGFWTDSVSSAIHCGSEPCIELNRKKE